MVINIIFIIFNLMQGVAMSTPAVMPSCSFVQTPIFSVFPSSFSLSPMLDPFGASETVTPQTPTHAQRRPTYDISHLMAGEVYLLWSTCGYWQRRKRSLSL